MPPQAMRSQENYYEMHTSCDLSSLPENDAGYAPNPNRAGESSNTYSPSPTTGNFEIGSSQRTSGASYLPRLSDSEITFPVMCSACVDVFHAGSARALAVVFPRSQGPLPRKDYVVFRGQRDPMAHDSLTKGSVQLANRIGTQMLSGRIIKSCQHSSRTPDAPARAANHHEVRLVQLCFDFYMIEAKPENLSKTAIRWMRRCVETASR